MAGNSEIAGVGGGCILLIEDDHYYANRLGEPRFHAGLSRQRSGNPGHRLGSLLIIERSHMRLAENQGGTTSEQACGTNLRQKIAGLPAHSRRLARTRESGTDGSEARRDLGLALGQ